MPEIYTLGEAEEDARHIHAMVGAMLGKKMEIRIIDAMQLGRQLQLAGRALSLAVEIINKASTQ